MEFACKVAGSKLIVVLGHSRCGAIRGAVDQVKLGNLTGLLEKLEPAIETVKKITNFEVGSTDFMDAVVEQNVHEIARKILKQSEILANMVSKGEIGIAKGVYSVESGKVEFY